MASVQNTDATHTIHGIPNPDPVGQHLEKGSSKGFKDKPENAESERGPIVGYTSPHDVILAEVYGDPPPEPTNDGYLREEDLKNIKIKRKEGEHSPSVQSQPVGGTREMLYDPFDGTPLGILATDGLSADKKATGSYKRTSRQSHGEKSDDKGEQWPHLSRVLKLQTEISKMHLNMEGIGPGDKGKGAGKGRRGKGVNSLDTRSRQHTFWGEGAENERHHPGRGPTSDTIGDEHEGDEEGVDVAGDEENEILRKREAEFASMADHFEERKQAINEIMGKLDDLSKALTDFHSSQPPKFEFTRSSSRQTTGVTPDATPPHIQTNFPAPYASTNLPAAAPPMLLGSKSISPNPLTPPDTAANIIPASLSRTQAPQSKAVASFMIDSVEPGKQRQFMDSPDSIQQHVKLPEM